MAGIHRLETYTDEQIPAIPPLFVLILAFILRLAFGLF
jgi:hypothetical protein